MGGGVRDGVWSDEWSESAISEKGHVKMAFVLLISGTVDSTLTGPLEQIDARSSPKIPSLLNLAVARALAQHAGRIVNTRREHM